MRGVDIPEEAGVIGIEPVGDPLLSERRTDIIHFDKERLFDRLVDEAIRPDFTELRELAPPRLERAGTVRDRAAVGA